MKECISIYKNLKEDDAIALVYDLVEEIKKQKNHGNSAPKIEIITT